MGCAFSKDYDADPRIFNVWNVDGHGHPIKPGRIEVTGSELILYQKTNTVVKWPLISLRRYGFDTEVFSFECGRRCSTGAGVYAFRCNRAQALFAVLQESIINSTGTVCNNMTPEEQASAASHTSSDLVNSPHSASSVPNGHVPNLVTMSPLVDAFGYLQPNTGSNFIHFQPPIPVRSNSTAGSPGGYITFQDTNNPEGMTQEWPVMPSSPPGCCSFGTCGGSSISASPSNHHYVNKDVIDQSSNCSSALCIVNQYVNSGAMADDLSQRCCSPTRRCSEKSKNTYVNSAMVTLSPGHLQCSGGACPPDCTHCLDLNTNYAKLDDLLKQEQSVKRQKERRFYVNIKPDASAQSGSSASSKCVSGRSTPTELLNKCGTLVTPTSPGSTKTIRAHCYANLISPTTSEAVKEQVQLTYAILDLEQSESANNNVVSPVSAQNSLHSLTSSPVKTPEGYAQIDFDKTVALSNSANPCSAFNDDSMRKTRHNAKSPCTSMTA